MNVTFYNSTTHKLLLLLDVLMCCLFVSLYEMSSLSSPSLLPPTQYHGNCCQHWSSRHPSGWPGYHGNCIDIGGTAHRGHNTDHRCGLVLVSSH